MEDWIYTMKKKKLRLIIPFILIAAAIVFLIRHITAELTLGRYTVNTDESLDITIAQISDLHSCRYGKDMEELVNAADSLSPDIVCYVTGNHEHRRDPDELNNETTLIVSRGLARKSHRVPRLNNAPEVAEIKLK